MWKPNCALDEDSAGVTVVGSRTNLGVPALTGPLQQTSLNVGYKIQVSRAHTAGSGCFKWKKSEPFPGILQCGAAFWPTTWLPCRMVATFVESESQQHFRCKQATNKQWQRVHQSVCGSSALWHCLLACPMSLCFNQNVRQDRKFQVQRDLQYLCQMRGAVVNRVCTRQSTRQRQWLCNEKAFAVLARRRSEILERCSKLFSFHWFCWKHLCCLSS